jgi:hypothetical protein
VDLRTVRVIIGIVLGMWILTGCETRRPLFVVDCTFSDECPHPLICAARYCRAECRTSRDCASGLICVTGARTEHSNPNVSANICIDPKDLPPSPLGPIYPLEPDTNRPGMEIIEFPIGEPGVDRCKEACTRDASCMSFTYFQPGSIGSTGYCSLKDGIPAAVPDTCCTSGRVR